MTRAEHLDWSKQRALALLPNCVGAFASMVSDLGKHPETADHCAIELGTQLLMIGDLGTPEKMRAFILGFN